jgi:small subunit ribosomal protein S8
MMTDPISDMLARLRNCVIARIDRAEMPYSSIKENVAQVLKREGFVDDVRVGTAETSGFKTLTIVLRYGAAKESAIDGIRRISSPGRRVYVRHDRIPRVRSGMGISILSTSRGVMTDADARKQRVGGELLCEVW